MGHSVSKPYAQRTDLEKIQSQWNKISGHHYRDDWSAAIVRAATAAELAVNYAIRTEFAKRSKFDTVFVDGLLKWANGISGKVDRLLIPLFAGKAKHGAVVKLRNLSDAINRKRNGIAHRGEFASKKEATDLIKKCRQFVHGLVGLYDKDFKVVDKPRDRDTGEQDP